MNQLEFLWSLQKHDKHLNILKKTLEGIDKRKIIHELEVRLKEIEYDLTNKKTQLQVDEFKIQRDDNKLKQLRFNLEEIQKRLYSGNISDLKQLTHMTKESGELKMEIDKLENGILSLMEKVEELKIEITYDESVNIIVNKELVGAISEFKGQVAEIQGKIDHESIKINKIVENIDEDTLKHYNQLKNRKGMAIAEIMEEKCSGCHMTIPTSLLRELKCDGSIVFCDNCGRILYQPNNMPRND